MAHYELGFTILTLLIIHHASTDNSAFTKTSKIPQGVVPFKFNNEMHFMTNDAFGNTSIFTRNRTDNECHLRDLDVVPSWVWILGNEKLLINDKYITHFNVIDSKKCSHPVNISNDEDENNIYLFVNYGNEVALVTYNDTFDVFDRFQKVCAPCRFNDKGERLRVEHPLGEDLKNQTNDGFLMDRIDDSFGVTNGYLYVFRNSNGTTSLRILDSEFKLTKQRLFPAKIDAHSLTHGNLTVCYKVNPCSKLDVNNCAPFCYIIFSGLKSTDYCDHVECHMLDSDLKTIAEVKLHQATVDPQKLLYVQMRVQNLIGGGAMVAMQFQYGRAKPVHHKDVFIQRIHPNGSVDPAILFDSLENDFVTMYDFAFDNGEYCLVTVNIYYAKGTHTLVKCLNPSPANYTSLVRK